MKRLYARLVLWLIRPALDLTPPGPSTWRIVNRQGQDGAGRSFGRVHR